MHSGDVFRFWNAGPGNETAPQWNYIGEGINGGQRVLDAAGKHADDVIFVSDRIKNALQAAAIGKFDDSAKRLYAALQNRGRRRDKHGKPWRLYELNQAAVDMYVDPEAIW